VKFSLLERFHGPTVSGANAISHAQRAMFVVNTQRSGPKYSKSELFSTRLFYHRSLRRDHLSGIVDRDVIAFRTHFEVALVESDDRRAMADGHDRCLR
jgi:hypothetical protein